MTLLIIYLLIALLVSFLCSILEAVILSVSPLYVTIKLQEQKPYARILQHYKENIDKPLAAILTLNTFAHTIGAAGVGAQAQRVWGNEYLTATSIILTILILIFSEIIPKTLGANYWKQLTPFMVYAIRFMVVILYPFIIVSQLITRFLNRKEKKGVLSRYEFSAMADAGEKAGVFRRDESRIIKNIARFDKLRTKDIMTPRTMIMAASEDTSIGEFHKTHLDNRFSRVPLFAGSVDHITGYMLKDELLIELVNLNQDAKLSSLKRTIQVVFENLPIPELYKTLVGKNEHIALVVDEYGGTAGIVTMEDLIETILGLEIIDEMDTIEDLQETARQRWKERARRMGLEV